MALKALFSQYTFTPESLACLEDELQAPRALCRVCQGNLPFNAYSKLATERAPGSMCFLPSRHQLQTQDDTWAVNEQPQLLDGAFSHPCIVLRPSSCGHLVLCAPCTSFGGRDITQRMKGAHASSDKLYNYLAIRSSNKSTADHHNPLSPLALATVDAKDHGKPSYACLNTSFWIEKWALNTFHTGGSTLTTASLVYLRWLVSLIDQDRDRRGAPDRPAVYGAHTTAPAPRWRSRTRGPPVVPSAPAFIPCGGAPWLAPPPVAQPYCAFAQGLSPLAVPFFPPQSVWDFYDLSTFAYA